MSLGWARRGAKGRSGEAALRAALRRWRRPLGRGRTGRWWPQLTPSQVQALLGAGITLGLLLWEQLRQRLGWK